MRAALLALLAATVLTTATSAVAATRTGALEGVVTVAPAVPVCRAGIPCSTPARVTLVFRRSGAPPRRVRTHDDGSYSIRLPAGTYRVSVRPAPAVGRGLSPTHVRVRAGRRIRADFR